MVFIKRFTILALLVFSNLAIAQSLALKVDAESEAKTAIIDSVGYQKTFENYRTIASELDTLKYKLTRLGYIDTTLDSVFKLNDTLFKAQFYLGTNYRFICIVIGGFSLSV